MVCRPTRVGVAAGIHGGQNFRSLNLHQLVLVIYTIPTTKLHA